jgi:ubiquinone/menaquinone biosynthesis C-methylase UbiE
MPDREQASSGYRRIAPLYDLVDLPFEYVRYRPLRRMLFAGLSGLILDAGVGTGRNMDFYPPGAAVTGIDVSPAMLARAEHRRARLALDVTLLERDLRDTRLPDQSFDAIVASFVFCVLPQEHHHAALPDAGFAIFPTSIALSPPASPIGRPSCFCTEPAETRTI